MGLKGISPLVAVVMLIAFTLLVAGILGGLVTQFAQEQREVVQFCTGARVLVLSGVYQSGTSSVILSVQNFGDVDLNFNILETANDETVSRRTETLSVQSNDVGQVTLTGVTLSSVKEYTVQSVECAGAQDFISTTEFNQV